MAGLFDDLIPASPTPEQATQQAQPSTSAGLFDDLIPSDQAVPGFRPGMYENGVLVAPSGPAALRSVSAIPAAPAPSPVVGMDEAPIRTGGAGVDRLIGSQTGMLSGAQSYEAKQAAEAAANAEVARRSQINTDLRAAPASSPEFAERNPLFEMGAAQRAAEERRTGVPVPVSPMEPQIDPVAQAEANRAREIGYSEAGFDTALKERQKVITGQPQTQDPLRSAGESLAASLVGIPAGAVDAAAILGKTVASEDGAKRIDELNQAVQQYANGLAKPDPTQADSLLAGKLPQGVGSTFGFAVTGVIGKALGLSATATTALAGALPQAAQMYRDAEAKGASETDKWIAFASGLGLGATEALPIANAMERWAHQVGGFQHAFRNTMVSIAEETTQEFGQQLGENAVAGATYDPTRKLTEGVAESALVGGLTGGLLGGAGSFGHAATNRGGPVDVRLQGEPGAGIDSPPGVPAAPAREGLPIGAQAGDILLGPDPSMAPAPEAPPPRNAGLELRDILNDPRKASEIRAEMEAKKNEPQAPEPGMVRMWHGGQDQTPDGRPRWFSSDRNYAQGYSSDGTLGYVDLPLNHPLLDRFNVDDYTNIQNGMTANLELPGDIADQRQIIPGAGQTGEKAQQDGSRTAPVAIETPQDVTHASERTVEPTPAQAEAGNYTKRHVKWNGLDISIETEAGQDRKGVDPNGQPWSVTLPTPYGYIKRTKGADGDHLDVYVGPNPQGNVYVVDQIDPGNAKFDEHKAMLGFDSEQQARAYYEAAFSDGNGPARAGHVSEMTPAQFKQWAQNGNTKRPLRYTPPIHAGLSQDQFRQLRGVIRDGSAPLDPAALSKTLGAPAKDIADVLGRMTGTNEVRMSREGRFSRVPQRGGIADLMQFIAARGGIETGQAREVQDLNKAFVPGYGKIARATGRNLDETREAAIEAGYLREGSTINDLIDAIDWSTRGRKTFSTHDQDAIFQRDEKAAHKAAGEINSAAQDRFKEAADSLGVKVSDGEIAFAEQIMHERGVSEADALVEAIERIGIQTVEEAHDSGWMTDEDWADFDSSIGTAYGRAAPKPARTAEQEKHDNDIAQWFKQEGARGESAQAGERQGAEPREEAGSAPAGEQSREAGEPAREVAADDTDESVEQRLTAQGPWDFNDAYPLPKNGRGDVEEVAAFVEDQLSELVQHNLDIAKLERQIEQIGGGKAEKNTDGRIVLRVRMREQASAEKNKIYDLLAEAFNDAAVAAIWQEGTRRTQQEQRTTDSKAGPSRADREETQLKAKPTVEPGAEGKPQTVIPGAERIGQGEQAQRAADKPMAAKKPQQAVGGMFDEANTAAQLFDDIPATVSQKETVAERPKEDWPTLRDRVLREATERSSTIMEGRPDQIRKAIESGATDAQIVEIATGGKGGVEGASGDGWSITNRNGKMSILMADETGKPFTYPMGSGTMARILRDLYGPPHPSEETQKAADRRMSDAVDAIEVAIESGDRKAVAAAGREARRILADTDAAIIGEDPDYWDQFEPLIKRMLKPGYVTSTQQVKADEEASNPAEKIIEPVKAAPAAPEPDKQNAVSSSEKGQANTVFTADAAEKARALLRDKLKSQLNAGLDPEMIQAGITLAGFHIEAGARSFAAYSKAMIEDLGEAVQPYLRSFYESVRHYPGFDTKGMSSAAEIESATSEAPSATPEAKSATKNAETSTTETIAQAMRQELGSGATYKTIREARALAEKATNGKITPSVETAKMIDEAVELGVVLAARDVVEQGGTPHEIYDKLVDLYARQPSLNVRTSTSMIEQAYSTPVPLAYVASQLAGITPESTVYEPSAGNGALLIGAKPENVVANELNADRRAALESQGFKVMDRDASAGSTGKAARDRNGGTTFNVVIENPPFGVVKDEKGNSTPYKIDDRYSTNEIDHAIVMRSLTSMSRDGRAVLIVGGPNKMASTEAARSAAYNGKAKREFYLTLYGEYNVVDHFTVSGDLYAKQGAGYPVDVIVIDGRGKSALKVPAAAVPKTISSWSELRNKLDVTETTGSNQREAEQPVRGDEPRRADDRMDSARGRLGERGVDTGRGVAVSDAGVQPTSADRSGERTADGSTQLQPEQRVPAGNVGKDTAGVQRRPTVAQQAQPSLFDSDASAETAPALEAPPQPKPRQAPAPAVPAAADMSKPQVPYRPRSDANGMGTLVPVNMQTTSQDALSALERRVGPIDDYVARELEYSPDELKKYFGAEQVDGIALGIDNFAKNAGFIIGDQTGIGKGRQVAGILRWAILKGRTPIFVTEKPNLYADMYRDLSDIGMAEKLGRDLKIFMTNSGETVPLDEEGKKKLTSPQAGPHQVSMKRMTAAGKLDDGYDMIFTTYAQMQTVKGAETERQKFLRAMATNNGVLALDEAHNAGGQAGAVERTNKDGTKILSRADFVRELLGLSSAALYSSATYAKRPDVMDLYFKTDMALAVDDISKLGDLITSGGIPMQQIVAAMLSRAGQYVRRERSFDGITYDTPVVEVDTAKYEEFSSNIALIQDFSENYVGDAVKEMDQRLKEEGKSVSGDNSTGGAGASSTNFTAIMHNIINQMLLSMKAQDAADRAVAALKSGQKPVITLANTNESFLDEYAESVGAEIGDPIAIRFNDILMRYLERSRMVTIKKPFAKAGDTIRLRLTDEDLGPGGVRAFNEARAAIKEADFSGLPVSPIDWIRSQIVKAGYTVSEITGRGLTLDYRADGQSVLKSRPSTEKSITGRRTAIGGFNSGKLDVLILNQSGSTGLSLHASEKVLNQNQRLMIIAQAEGNIDTHMQMLGRVNRTGQVVKPAYQQLVAGVPAEKRPASILAKKMASLNANTTGARDSAVTAKDTPDFMNSYGDRVAAIVMQENPDINRRLGRPVSFDEEVSVDGAMRKVTGRIPLLSLKEQENLYDLLQSEYEALIQQLEASGQNALEAKTLPLDAKTIETNEVKEGKDASGPFAESVTFERVDAKRLGKPMKPEEVITAIKKTLGVEELNDTEPTAQLSSLGVLGRVTAKEIRAETVREFDAYAKAQVEGLKKEESAQQIKAKLADVKHTWLDLHEVLTPGQGVVLKTDQGNFYGVVLDTSFSGRAKNPMAMSAWRTDIALADPARRMTVPFSQIYTHSTKPEKPGEYQMEIATTNSIGSMPLLDAFGDMQTERREDRIMVTGNILGGYDFVAGKGQIVNFTDDQGRLRQGIFMPRGFDAEKFLSKKAVALRSGDQVVTYLDRVARTQVKSPDTFIRISKTPGGDVQIAVDAARQNGGKYFLNRGVLDAARKDFVKMGGEMRLQIPPYRAREVIDALLKSGAQLEVSDNVDVARDVVATVPANSAFSPATKGWQFVEPGAKREMSDKDKFDLAVIIGSVAGPGVTVTFPKRIDIPAGTKTASAWGMEDKAFEAGGYYDFISDVIGVSQNIGSPGVAYHEAFHRLQSRALTPQQLATLKAENARLKEVVARSVLNRDVSEMSQREIEADAFAIYSLARDAGEHPAGIPAQVRQIWNNLYQMLRAAVNFMKGRGFQTYETIFDKAWRGDLAEAADKVDNQQGKPNLEFSVPPGAQDTIANRQTLMWQALRKGQPIDRIMRMPFDWFGGLNKNNEWNPALKVDPIAQRAIYESKFSPNGKFAFLNPLLENARAGWLDRYGQDPEYNKRDRARANDERAVLAQGREILTELMKQQVGAEEAKVLQAMLTGEAVSEGDMGKLAEPIRQAIDELGALAVQYGLVSAESYERNRGTYLHRVYTKDMQDTNSLTRFAERIMTSRRKHILGDALKGRGIFLDIDNARITQDDPDFAKAGRGAVVKGEKFIMIRKTTEQINTDGQIEERETKRIWWPADKAIPDKYQGLKNGGTWEARAVGKDGKVTLWRDYTKEERTRMGEILDARYTIGKTYALMAHDLANGKFYKDIAENEDWSQSQVPDQPWRDASNYNRYWNDPAIEWVKVPDTEIPNTGGKKRWGALSGKYVRAEIWRDLNETAIAQNPSTWRRLYNVWKLNKTARSPVTHMNNVMSNLFFMDMADIRFSELITGIKAFMNKDAAYREAADNGAFGNDMMAVEFKKEVLQPLLDELMQQQTTNGVSNPFFAKAAFAGKMVDTLWNAAKTADKKMIDTYRIEDEVFRMATFIKRRELGDTPQEAADFARRQFLDYDIKAPWVNALRQSWVPFLAYPYRAVPLIAQALAHRPWKLAKYFAISYAMNAIAYGLDGDGDEDRERASLRKDEQGRNWVTMTPRMMRMPWRDANGLPVFLDIRRWTPAGDVFDMGQGSSALPIPAPMMPGGPLMLAAEFMLNKQAFTGKAITNDRTDTWGDEGQKVGDWAWKSIMPNAPWVPGSWSGERIGKAWSGGTDRAGNPLSMKEAVSSSFGVKLAGRDIDAGFANKFFEMRKAGQDLKQEARALARQRGLNTISQSTFEKELAHIIEKQRRIANDAAELGKQAQTREQREAAK